MFTAYFFMGLKSEERSTACLLFVKTEYTCLNASAVYEYRRTVVSTLGPTNISFGRSRTHKCIGVASYRARAPLTSNCLIFWVTSELHKLWHSTSRGCLSSKTEYTVYCMNFIIFLCVTLKLFYFSFVPVLAPNPGAKTGTEFFKVK